MTVIPAYLAEQIKNGQVVLFLGAGASLGASHPEGKSIPIANHLAQQIADRFLGSEYREAPLAQVVELATSESSLFSVQTYIADLFNAYEPAEFHKLIPKFAWKAIASTNFDLIVERAYDSVPNRVQELVVFKKNGEPIESRLGGHNKVIYLKLHGCITDINDAKVPLILTPDQYVTHRQGRNRLFERLQDLASEYPILFVGHSLQDISVRNTLLEIDELIKDRPRSYIVSPVMGDIEVRFWETKRLTHVTGTFEEFLEGIDNKIPIGFRRLAIAVKANEHPIMKRLSFPAGKAPSESLMAFLERDGEYVHGGLQTTAANPKAFYKGYFVDWAPIAESLDVQRAIKDDILSEVFLATEEERPSKQEFYLVKGHAGSGKGVLLRRIAWDAATSFDKLCIVLKERSQPSYDAFLEMAIAAGQRIFLFVDPVNEFSDTLENFMRKAKNDNLALTIIGAERFGEWNTSCEHLEAFLTGQYEVRYLSEHEIEQLINLLKRHQSLGHLGQLSFEEQKEELKKRAGRQLLVALHETTEGKPFEEIVLDEYRSISSRRAQSLYLTTCIFHRLGVPIRAGLISRVHGIRFTDFEEELFKPLEYIVFAQKDNVTQDYVYRARHQHIAELVFEQVLTDQQDRYDEYIRIINNMDIDYSSDREALKGLTNAKSLLKLFSKAEMIRGIFGAARERFGRAPMQMQQEAIFEMDTGNGNLERAQSLLEEAYQLQPRNNTIAHSLSVLALKKSRAAQTELEKTKYRNEAVEIAHKLTNDRYPSSHAFHTIISAGTDEIRDLLDVGDEPSVERVIKQIERTILRANQMFPGDEFILDAEAKFHQALDKNDEALAALRKAHDQNKRSPFIAMRLAKVYDRRGETELAAQTLRDCIEYNPEDKDLCYRLAVLLEDSTRSEVHELRYLLRKSFTRGDSNYDAQFRYARILYLESEFSEARELFETLNSAPLDNRVKRKSRAPVIADGKSVFYTGTIVKKEASYGFIARDRFNDEIYTRQEYTRDSWHTLRLGSRVRFGLAFNYRGPVAVDVEQE